ncbi:MAG: hypothetical protein JNM94_07510 [Phycisphaerae bacterium]|nr:hypothetical protein [Phycisphaerae bacterium]
MHALSRPLASFSSVASAVVAVALVGCSSSTPAESGPASPAAIAESTSRASTFLPTDAPGVWNPVRPGVAITVAEAAEPKAMRVSYRRDAGKPAGVALMLEPGACNAIDAFAIRVAATPSQRFTVSLTDHDGVVWTFPTVKATSDVETYTVRLEDLRPDPFQNGGKTIPASPDLGRIKMLTILDISGFMGAPVEECTWTIESVIGEEGAR